MVASGGTMPKGIRLTEQEQSQRRRAIASASVDLFLAQGFPETSMRQIAEAAGVGKSSLYDYFSTKDDILLFIIEDMGITLTERAQAIAGLNVPPDARLRQIMEMHLAYLQANNNLFWLLGAEAQRLKPESQRRIQERRYVFQDLVAAIIQEGIERGNFRQVDPLNAARLLLNSLFSVLYTTRPTGSAEARLDEVVDIFLRGIEQ
jgi:TetR/AcrR family transcriptional regulator, cholesterol catabolism regulator